MRVVAAGRLLFAISVAGLGLLSLLSGDFALNWQPVPTGVPGREALAYLSGAVLVIFGLGLLVPRVAVLSALVLTADFLIWLVVLRLAQLTKLFDAGAWLGIGETTILVCGAWALLWDAPAQFRLHAVLKTPACRAFVRILFGVGVPLIGIAHFVFAKETAEFVPAYLPMRLGFAYLTGAAHIAAGAAVLAGVLPRLAVILEGAMMSTFAVMVWAPRVLAEPHSRFAWTALLVSFAYGAGSLIMAHLFPSVDGEPR